MEVLKPLGYSCFRADDIVEAGPILDRVINHVFSSDIVIAFLDYENVNVYYELALRHSTGKFCISVVSDHVAERRLPFDVRQIRVIVFPKQELVDYHVGKTLTDGLMRFRDAISSEIASYEKGQYEIVNPITEATRKKTITNSLNRNIQAINSSIVELSELEMQLYSRLQALRQRKQELLEIHSQYTKLNNEVASFLENDNTSSPRVSSHQNNGVKRYDVFISYASEDRDAFVTRFTSILKDRYGLRIWYDEDEIVWGDNFKVKIDEGLEKAKIGVVILSKSYFRKQWTQYEYTSLFAKGKKLLPIWHNISEAEIREFNPELGRVKALRTSEYTPDDIASSLVQFLEQD